MYYDTTLQKAFARGVKAHLNDLPNTWKLTFMLGRYLQSEYNGVFYSKSQNLVRELCKAYDKILEDFDVLLMPTAPKKARTFPSPDSSLEGMAILLWEPEASLLRAFGPDLNVSILLSVSQILAL